MFNFVVKINLRVYCNALGTTRSRKSLERNVSAITSVYVS